MAPSAPQVGGNWFSAAMASNQPQLMKAAGARRILIHHIQVTPRALRFHLHQRSVWEAGPRGAEARVSPHPVPHPSEVMWGGDLSPELDTRVRGPG